METHHAVPHEIWIKSLAYLDAKDLLAVGLVDRSFLKLSSDDSIWYELCNRRWRGKFNVARFFLVREYNEVDSNHNINRDESISIPFTTAMTYCSALIEQFDGIGTVPALNMGSLMHQPSWWKESYWMAELDSRRRIISREELVNFRFQLIYNGVPSRMGLRHFNRDGYYDSPYMGRYVLCDAELSLLFYCPNT